MAMDLTTYGGLKDAIVHDFLNRSDLADQVSGFITLAEAEMKRRLRRSQTATTIYIYAEATTLPTDVASIISLRLSTGSASLDKPLRLGTVEMLSERRARANGVAGRPDMFAYYAGQLHVQPEPDQSYDAKIVYNTQLTALSDSNTSNTILVEAPDAYLYGALLQAEGLLENDERIPLWQSKFNAAIEQLNAVADEEAHNASIKDVRFARVFG